MNASYPGKYITQSGETFMYFIIFINLPHNYKIFQKICQNQN